MASYGGLAAPPIFIPLRQGDAMEDKMAATLLGALWSHSDKFMDKNSSTTNDSILFLLTSPQKLLQGHNETPLREKNPFDIHNLQDGHAQV